jgi:ERCC4-related helicase
VVFTAPTKPLVAQQVEACQKITGIGNELIAELTGNKSADTRRISWSKRRLFFMTPETFRNDLQSNCCDVEKIALVIFDEAHRASGQYAYCEIIKALESERAVFRVLALSATPANDPRKVQGVIQNLYIERLQLRTEDSFDVAPFIFKKTIEEIVVKPSPLMNLILEKFLPFLEAPIRRLKQNHCINFDNAATIAPYFLLKAREGWRTRKASLPQAVQGMIEGDFGLAHTLAGFRDLLLNCGIRAFYEKVHAFILEIKQKSNSSRKKLELVKNQAFISLMQMLEEKMTEKDFSSHPKLDILVEVVVEHFKKHEKTIQDAMKHGDLDIQNETKVMIFSTLRSSVEEICNLLEKHSPLVRPSIFVGQATSGKNNIGMKQKEQLMVEL